MLLLFFLIGILLFPRRFLPLWPFADLKVTSEVVLGEESFVALLTDKVSAALMRVHVLLQVVGFEEVFVALWALNPTFICVREHVLFQVMFPEESPVAEVTLVLLCNGVDEHM